MRSSGTPMTPGVVELQELREHHARRPLVELEHLRVERVEAGGAAEEQLAAAIAVVRAEVEFFALQAVQPMETLDRRSVLRIDARQAEVGADPDVAHAVGAQAVDGVVGQALRLGDVGEAQVCGRFGGIHHAIEAAAARADPDAAGVVDQDASRWCRRSASRAAWRRACSSRAGAS